MPKSAAVAADGSATEQSEQQNRQGVTTALTIVPAAYGPGGGHIFSTGLCGVEMNTGRNTWTRTEQAMLRKMAKKFRAKQIARKLKRTEGAVRQKAFTMGVSLEMRA
jgi:hypothetical protein